MNDKRFHSLYLEHYPGVFGFFIRKGFTREDAKDLTQDVFLLVVRFRHELREKDRFRAWLNSIAYNLWKNKIRELQSGKRQGIEVPFLGDYLEGEGPYLPSQNQSHPLQGLVAQEQKEQLWWAISQLPDDQRACMILRLRELSYEQIANILQIPEKTVKSRIHQAKNKLGDIVDNEINVRYMH